MKTSANNKNKKQAVELILLIFAPVFLYNGIQDLYKATLVTYNGQRTIGVIIERDEGIQSFADWLRSCSVRGGFEKYTVEYRTNADKTIKANQIFCMQPNYDLHDKVEIIYSKSNPQIMSLEYGIGGTWLSAIVRTLFGLGSLTYIAYSHRKDMKILKKKYKR